LAFQGNSNIIEIEAHYLGDVQLIKLYSFIIASLKPICPELTVEISGVDFLYLEVVERHCAQLFD
jgi:hypothetical protein